MAMDVYAPCPCGSGKKLKFCCQNIAEDMDRISRLMDDNQHRQALQQLDALDRRVPDHHWAITTRALVLLEMGDAFGARDRLKPFVERHPEHEFATVLYATSVFQSEGLDAARPAIARAFQKGAKRFPAMVSGLAAAMAAVFRARGRLLAAREHLALSLRFALEQNRQEIFVRLLEFDNEATIPYLLRSAHPLPQISGSDEIAAEVRKAHKYASVGCWNVAAEIFEKIAAQLPDAAEPWQCAGLCRAYDGDDDTAAQHLHRAASLQSRTELAVEAEAIAQILDWNSAEPRRQRMLLPGAVSSVSRLLTVLDAAPQLQRAELPPPEQQVGPVPAATYHVINVTKDQVPGAAQLSLANVPVRLAEVAIFDADPQLNEPPEIEVLWFDTPANADGPRLVREAAGDLVTWSEVEPSGEFLPEEVAALMTAWWFPPKTPVARWREIELEHWRHAIEQVWKTSPQRGLQGKSPVDAASQLELKVPLLAAVYVLDSVCLRSGYELDTTALIQSLGLEPLPTTSVTPETSLNALCPLQWLRLPLDQLTDDQLTAVVNRAQLIHHDRFLYDTLKAALQRPEVLAKLDLTRIYQSLVDLCRVHCRREEAFHWFAEGRRHTAVGQNNFELQWSWDLRELLMRLEDPADPELRPMAQRFVQYYGPKLPQMRPYVEQMFQLAGVASPWSDVGLVSADSGSVGASGLWTPDAPAQPAAAGGGLWLPGT